MTLYPIIKRNVQNKSRASIIFKNLISRLSRTKKLVPEQMKLLVLIFIIYIIKKEERIFHHQWSLQFRGNATMAVCISLSILMLFHRQKEISRHYDHTRFGPNMHEHARSQNTNNIQFL